MVLEIPADLDVLVPPGAVNISSRSGTPEILDVKRMDPSARAEIGRPEGANTTARFSTMSTYNSLLVCRTFCFRHGIAGPLAELEAAFRVAARFDEGPNAGEEVGIPTCVKSLPSPVDISTCSRRALPSVLQTTPPSQISLRS